MRVFYFHQHFTTLQGSGGTRSYEFARALIRRGHQVTMICGENDRAGLALPFDPTHKWSRGNIDGIDVVVLPLPYSNRDSLARRACMFLRFGWRSSLLALTEDYDLLFATSTPLTAGIAGIVMKGLGRGRKFIFEVRDLWPELPRQLGMKNPFLLGGMSVLEWLSYRTSDACIGLSPGIVTGIRARSRTGHPVAMIPNGCDLELFQPGRRDELRLAGVAETDFVAAFTGAHGVANGLGSLLDVAQELKRRGRVHIKLVFIGDGKEKERLVRRAETEGLDNCLFFAPMKKYELARLTACVDCGLMILANVPAFYYGTSPNKFFDYIAAGLPVITNYPGWLAELIAANNCGLVVPPADPSAFADALTALADAPDRRRAMGVRARELACREFAREKLADGFVDLVEAVVAGARVAR